MTTAGPRRALARATSILPRGSGIVGAWLLVTGLASYGFLTITGRALGPERYGGLSALWALGFLLGPGACLPVEQEVSRALASRRARGLGGGPLVRRATIGTGVLAAVLVAAALAAGPWLVENLFDDEVLLLVGLVLLLAGYALEYLARGVLAGNARFGSYGVLLGAEAGSRLLVSVLLVAVGVATAGPYGVVLGIAPFIGVLASLTRREGLVTPGPPAPWRELSRAFGWLLAGSLFAQALINTGPILVQLLAPAGNDEATGQFLASLVIARIPVFLFQGVQAALLPRLAGHAGAGQVRDLRSETRRMTAAVGALCVVATAAAWLLGPTVVRLAFGADFALDRRDLAVLAAASCIYLLGLTLSQALIALKHQARVAVGWGIGIVTLAIVTILGHDLLLRVELGFLAGAGAAAVAMALLLASPMRRGVAASGPTIPESRQSAG
ncbi:MAG: lipopolysaccharide biosynthesis protein [Acidimicrobiia bacterium]